MSSCSQSNNQTQSQPLQQCPPEAKKFFMIILTLLVLIFIAILYK